MLQLLPIKVQAQLSVASGANRPGQAAFATPDTPGSPAQRNQYAGADPDKYLVELPENAQGNRRQGPSAATVGDHMTCWRRCSLELSGFVANQFQRHVGWLLCLALPQVLMSSGVRSFGIAFTSMKAASQNILDPVNLGRHASRRNSHHLSDRGCVHALPDTAASFAGPRASTDGSAPSAAPGSRAGHKHGPDIVRHRLDRFQRHQHAVLSLLPDHMRRRDIVRHAIHPRSKGTPAVENAEASPQRHVNILQQVAAFFGIGFIGARQAVQRPAIAGGCLPIQLVLAGIGFYVQIVARVANFLTRISRRAASVPSARGSTARSPGPRRR